MKEGGADFGFEVGETGGVVEEVEKGAGDRCGGGVCAYSVEIFR